MYYSQVYKENVLSLNLSSSKSFIMNKHLWLSFKRLLPLINNFFENEISIQTPIQRDHSRTNAGR